LNPFLFGNVMTDKAKKRRLGKQMISLKRLFI
jgi:hypothetical protein